MRKLFVALTMVLLFCPFAEAAHLASQIYTPAEIQPTYFRLIPDGGAVIQSPAGITVGGVWMYWDDSSLGNGSHTFQLWACNGPTFPDNCSTPVVIYTYKKGLPAPASLTFVVPYLNSQVYAIDQTLEPTYFIVAVDGGASVQSPAVAVTGGVWMHYDVGGLSDGNHSTVVTTHNLSGNSTPITYNFVVGRPAAPTGIRRLE